MRLRRTELVAAVLFLLALVSESALGGPIDPLLTFQVIRTEHFRIYFHQGEEQLAHSLADIAERAHDGLTFTLGASRERQTDVVLLDQIEEANGWATPLPRNTVVLNAAAPAGSEMIGNTPDWLETVFRHEYTHILHLDRSRGWARVARGMLGRSPAAFPNLWLPQWQIEGLATLEESAGGFDGRLNAGDFRTITKHDLASGHRLTMDRASGGLVGWPGALASYAAGLEFHDYLLMRFGPGALERLADSTAGRLPYFSSGSFKRVFGESLGSLWRAYEASLNPGVLAQQPDAGVRRITHRGEVALAPRFLPGVCENCTRRLVYASRTPHEFPSLRSVTATGDDDRALTTRYLGSTTAVTSDYLLFDQQELHRSVSLLSDLYVLDRRTGDVERLTYGSRLQDPDVSADGRRLVAVREDRGRRDLVQADLVSDSTSARRLEVRNVRVLLSETETQFNAPRWSPDGRHIAVERRRLGTFPGVVVVTADTGQVVRAWGGRRSGGGRVVTPAWRPDGHAIVAAMSMGMAPFDLFELPLEEAEMTRLTWTASGEGPDGAFWPDVSADGREIAFVGYTAAGYDIFVVPYGKGDRSSPPEPWATPSDEGSPGRPADMTWLQHARDPGGPQRYSPFETLVPTSWTPLLVSDANQTRLGGVVSGADVLSRHAYALDATWLTQHGYLTSPLPTGPDWSASYAYTRWQPTFFGSLARETRFRRLAATASTAASTHAVVRHESQAGVLLPMLRVRRSTRALVSVVNTESRDLLGDRTVDARLVSARVGLSSNTSRQYGYSISREHGLAISGTVEATRRGLGSIADADTATVDARAYVPGIGRHHVLALRAAAATSRGDAAARQSVEIGVVSASSSGLDFGSEAVGLFRGVVSGANHANRLIAGNVEYRLPLKTIERGYGTLPLMLRTLHGSAFLDIVHAKDVGASGSRRQAAAGVELSLDAVAGYALPGSVSVGAAWTIPGRASGSDSRFYVRLGRAF